SAQQSAMFRPLYPADAGRRVTLLSVSLVLHFSFLIWLLHPPTPKFLAPSFVVRGERTGSATTPYFPLHSGQGDNDSAVSTSKTSHQPAAAQARVTWTKSRNIGKSREREIALSQRPPDPGTRASLGGNPAPPLGSPYGSLSQGTNSGFEVRPALWASGSDPHIATGELDGLEGNVIVEITIDDQGNVVHTAVLQSLSPVIDAKVVAALENWHFHPATRDGVAVPSKQDVYYHFPVRR
ncbi:MAG TPA: energy transducer TonB, partial [Terriglobales bacterium]|nr:energy transducer TonB [Terriglobales bacterium]